MNRNASPDPAIFMRDLIRATRTPRAAVALVIINVTLFALEVVTRRMAPFDVTPAMMIPLGATTRTLSLTTEPWRLFTALFLHVGAIHLLFNMVTLWRVGPLVERLFGTAPFVVIYLLSGLAGNLASSAFSMQGAVSAGASGAIFGVVGAIGGFLLRFGRNVPTELRRSFGSMTLQFVFINIAYGFAVPQIDNSAHMGGLVGGLISGLVIATPLTREGIAARTKQAMLIAGVGLLALGGVWFYLATSLRA